MLIQEAVICGHDKMPDVCAVGQAADFLVQFFHRFFTGGEHLVFCPCCIAAGIDLVMIDVNHRFAGEIAAQLIAAHILHLVKLDATAVLFRGLQDALACCGARSFSAKDSHRTVWLKFKTDMGQQRSHAKLSIRGHRTDRRGQLCTALGIHGKLFKQLLAYLVAHGVRDKHHHTLPCSTDIPAVKMGLPLCLEGGQLAGKALAPAHRQRIKEIVGVHPFHKSLQLFHFRGAQNLTVVQVELPVCGIHLPCAVLVLCRQCIDAVCRDEVQCFQHRAGIFQQCVLALSGRFCAKVSFAAFLADLPDAMAFQGSRGVFFQQAGRDPCADLFLCRIEHGAIQQQIWVCVLHLPQNLHGVQFLCSSMGEALKIGLVGQIVHHAVQEGQHLALLRQAAIQPRIRGVHIHGMGGVGGKQAGYQILQALFGRVIAEQPLADPPEIRHQPKLCKELQGFVFGIQRTVQNLPYHFFGLGLTLAQHCQHCQCKGILGIGRGAQIIEPLGAILCGKKVDVLLHKELCSLVQIEVLCDHGRLIGGELLCVAQHIGKVVFFQRRLCKGGVEQKALVWVLQLQHPFGGKLCVGLHVVYRYAGDIQLRYFVFKAGRFVVPEHQFALLALRKHCPETIFDLAQCRFSHACSSFLFYIIVININTPER